MGARRRQTSGTVWASVSSTASASVSRNSMPSLARLGLSMSSWGSPTTVTRAASRPSATVGGSRRTRRTRDPGMRMP